MQFTTQLISKIVLVALIAGCTTMSDDPERIEIKDPGPKSKTFTSPFLNVWKSSLIVIGKYPLKSYDEDTGIIETDFIKGEEAWVAPHKKKGVSGGYRYKVNLRVIRGKGESKNTTKVIVFKQIENQKDFFADADKIQTDGLEEKAILYRIERELALEEALSKVKRN